MSHPLKFAFLASQNDETAAFHRPSRLRHACRRLGRTLLGSTALLSASFPLALAAPPSSHAPAPAYAAIFHDLQGQPHSLDELRGHPAVVNFWATWCLPCREEMPRLQHQATLYTPRGVQFIAISIDDLATQPKIPALVQKRNFHLPVWTGGTSQTLLDLNLGEVVPATLVLDETGKPIGIIRGEAREKDIQSRLDWLLNGRPSPAPKLIQRNDW